MKTLFKIQIDPYLTSILLIALVVRLIFFFALPPQHFPDAIAYRTIGHEIFSGQLITNHIYMPLYPIFTFITGGGKIQILVEIILSVMSIWIIFLLAMRLFRDRLVSLFAASISAFYPHFIFFSLSGLTETFYIFLCLLSFLLFYRKQIVWGIIISIIAILIRPSFDLLNPLLVVCFVSFVHKLDLRAVVKFVCIYFVIYLVLMSSWWVHQYYKYDTFVRLTLGDGVVLYAGNNPLNKSGGGINGVDVDESILGDFNDPILRNKAQKAAAFEFATSNPTRFIELAGLKFIRFWRLWPYTDQYQQWYIIGASILSYGVVLILSIGFLFRGGRTYFVKLMPIYITVIYLTLVHMITIGSIRYRLPLEPFLIIFASHFIVDFCKEKQWLKYFHKTLT